MYWLRLLFHRVLLSAIAKIVLVPATIWAQYKELERLPWGLDPIFGCEEDGWNGNGIDPNNPRQGWTPGNWGKWKDTNNVPSGTQGWWADYLKVDWNKLSPVKRWWLSYKWCAIRNVCWNLRLRDWFGLNIHYNNIEVLEYKKHDEYLSIKWKDKDGRSGFHKRKKIFGIMFEYGYEFFEYVIDKTNPLYSRVHNIGYTREYKYKTKSVPSVRPRRK